MPAPAGGQTGHKEEATAGFLDTGTLQKGRIGDRGGAPAYVFTAGVGDLDTNQAYGSGQCAQAELEVPAGNMSVPHGVAGKLGDDQDDRSWASLSYKMPHTSRQRARRAPLRVEVKHIWKVKFGAGVSAVTGAVSKWPVSTAVWAVPVGSTGFAVMATTVSLVA